MKNILVIGAGRSATTLISYLLDNASDNDWFISIADYSLRLAEDAVNNNKRGSAIFFDVNDTKQREDEILKSDIVVSMLPASMHIMVAKDCIRLKKNLVTASYVSDEVSSLDENAKKAGVLLLNEIGLDPGIDHMSAMQIIDEIKEKGGELTSFKSFCGGLVHPDYDNNPWNYKFTWNPRNVVVAGQGGAQYVEGGMIKFIPYNNLFERVENMDILDAGSFEAYANRDSLSYRKSYGIKNISTLLRGTLRRKGYSESWNYFVQLGLTDDTYIIENSEELTYREYLNLHLPFSGTLPLEERFCKEFEITEDSDSFQKVKWLDIFTNNKVELKNATPAQILQKILEEKWTLATEDKDMIVMQHQFEYTLKGKYKKLNSSLLVFGENQRDTSMAKTVGLPVAIAVKLILNGIINSTGVKIPTTKDIYIPVLKELSENGINFIEEEIN